MTSGTRRFHWENWLVALVSCVVALGISEALVRFSLFHTPVAFASKDPEYYARTLDEYWIYYHLFSATKMWAIGSGEPDAAGKTEIEFYRKWATSLVPDAELGYVRKPDVRTPCHETTSLGTRGVRNYAAEGRKIVFLGDSFVESAACSSDTIATKVEKLTGIDTLNYGIGGYGVDQIFLYFKRVLPGCDRKDCLFLIGLIQDDLGRMLLSVRTSPKPYFTLRDDKLLLHTDHIHPDSLNDIFERPPARSYLYYFLRGRLGTPIYRSLVTETRDAGQAAIAAMSQRMFAEIATLMRQHPFRLAFVIFPTPGEPFDKGILSLLRAQNIPVVDLQGCLQGRSDAALYVEYHPTALGNDMLAQCLVHDLATLGLLDDVPRGR